MKKYEDCIEEIFNFFMNEVDSIFTVNDPPGYDHRLVFHNCEGKYLEFFNKMLDIEERLEIGQVFFETYDLFDSSFYDDKKGYAYIEPISNKLLYDDINCVNFLFININDQEYRSGIELNFSNGSIVIVPSIYPYCLKIYGFCGYDDGKKSEYSLDKYYKK